ncbi:hypothetical protein SAMN02744124_03691 [Paenibacillus barengoltzii J12]|uniref:Uncharacterized protein n=1 Tax=Paenibacillus barengoltzii J12 TaxID=935846 RepID=A0ABY1M1Q7_9BACL|nr:hypothetical protein SAMN02744124_03691 [Paenibacillus barengoltzii J12]
MLYRESDGRPAPYFYPNHITPVSFLQFSSSPLQIPMKLDFTLE